MKDLEKMYLRPCKLNYLFLIPVRANYLSPSGYILCIVVEHLISDNNPRRVYIVAIVFFKESSFIMALLHYYEHNRTVIFIYSKI